MFLKLFFKLLHCCCKLFIYSYTIFSFWKHIYKIEPEQSAGTHVDRDWSESPVRRVFGQRHQEKSGPVNLLYRTNCVESLTPTSKALRFLWFFYTRLVLVVVLVNQWICCARQYASSLQLETTGGINRDSRRSFQVLGFQKYCFWITNSDSEM